MPEMHLRQLGFTYNVCKPFTRTMKEYKNLKKQYIHDIFVKTNWTKLTFSMIWLMEVLRVCLEEQLLIKYYLIKDLILLKIQNLMDIKKVLLQCFINFLIKVLLVAVLKVKLSQNSNWQKNYTSQLLESWRKMKSILIF